MTAATAGVSPIAQWDAIVVGAGIIGAACARALAADGLRVLVLEARSAASGATAAGMGHLVTMDDSPAVTPADAASPTASRRFVAGEATIAAAQAFAASCSTTYARGSQRQLPSAG